MRTVATLALSRREFLQVSVSAAGGLAVALVLPQRAVAEETMPMKLPPAVSQPLGSFVRIEPDGRIVIGARGCEIGQGVRTSLPMLIAEELDVPWSAVTVEQLDFIMMKEGASAVAVSRYGDQFAGGSTSIRDSWHELRQVGARARRLLLEAAGKEWNESPDRLRTHEAKVLHHAKRMGRGLRELPSTGVSFSFIELTVPVSHTAPLALYMKQKAHRGVASRAC